MVDTSNNSSIGPSRILPTTSSSLLPIQLFSGSLRTDSSSVFLPCALGRMCCRNYPGGVNDRFHLNYVTTTGS